MARTSPASSWTLEVKRLAAGYEVRIHMPSTDVRNTRGYPFRPGSTCSQPGRRYPTPALHYCPRRDDLLTRRGTLALHQTPYGAGRPCRWSSSASRASAEAVPSHWPQATIRTAEPRGGSLPRHEPGNWATARGARHTRAALPVPQMSERKRDGSLDHGDIPAQHHRLLFRIVRERCGADENGAVELLTHDRQQPEACGILPR